MSCPSRNAVLAWILIVLPILPLRAQGRATHLVFAGGRIVCEIIAPDETIPEQVRTALPIAMNAAVEHIGAPDAPARLTLRLQKPPPFYKRLLVRTEAHAVQDGDEIRLDPGDDPLKLAFRLGHELSHWLVYRQYPVRPPLWLDEGLANGIAAAAAETCARTLKQTIARPEPPKLGRHLFALDELVARPDYPRQPGAVGAFYWQAEALVAALRRKLGPADFKVYLGLLAAAHPPAWDAPLRERWYFSDWDFNWLAEQIRPGQGSPP